MMTTGGFAAADIVLFVCDAREASMMLMALRPMGGVRLLYHYLWR